MTGKKLGAGDAVVTTEEIPGPPLAPPGDDGGEVNPMPHEVSQEYLVCPVCGLSECKHNLPYIPRTDVEAT